MKTKGITIWERHAEKFVLALAVLAAIGFTALQFIGEPNAVQSSANPSGEVAPHEVDDLLQEKAEQILARLGDSAAAGVELPDPVPAINDLITQRQRSLSPVPALPQFDLALAPTVEGIGPPGGDAEFPVPALAAPDEIAVAQYADALEDGIVEQYQLGQLFPDENQPHDLIFVTARARFDLADLRSQFRGEGDVVIPSAWYNDRAENIVDVVIEREELVDDQWTNLTKLAPIPGQFSFRTKLSGAADAALADEVLSLLSDPAYQIGLVQPAFYPTRNGDWSVPEAPTDQGPDSVEGQIDQLRQKRRLAIEQRDRLIEEFETKGGSVKEREEERRDRGGSAGGRSGSGGEGSGSGSGRRPPPGSGGKRPPPGSGQGGGGFGAGDEGDIGKRDRSGGGIPGKASKQELDRIWRKVLRQERVIANLERDLSDLGVENPDEEETATQFAALESDSILVWGHDLYVQPGKTYRYRFTVRVYNPFFGKKRSLAESQQELAESFTLDTATSDWSNPIRIHPPLRVFITDASPTAGGPMGLGRAKAEVYRFYDGNHWMETFSVYPGGAIGDVKEVRLTDGQGTIEIDFRTNYYVLDIVKDVDGGRSNGGRLPEAGSGARVLLQDLQTGETGMRDPQTELASPDRQMLRDKLDSQT